MAAVWPPNRRSPVPARTVERYLLGTDDTDLSKDPACDPAARPGVDPASEPAAELAAELEYEQRHLTRLYHQLDVLRERAAADLERTRRAPLVPTPAGRAERDAFDAWHSERLGRLSAVEERLAFGRLDLLGGEARYVGRIGMSDDQRTQLLLDWRAPAAAAFYQATPASPEGVVRRRHLASRARRITGLDDEILDVDGAAALAEQGRPVRAVAGEGALMSALTAQRTGRMRDIVATLQAEQDAVVRAPLAGVLVVQGGPGTGKTAVALHRAAYLLYTHRERIARSGVLVIGPSPAFIRYIEQVLPALGETGVVLSGLGDLVPGVLARAVDDERAALVKGDLRMVPVLREAVRARQRVPRSAVRIVLDGDPVELRPRVVADARARARQTGRPHNEARVTFVEHLLRDLTRQLALARRLPTDDESVLAELAGELRDSKDVRREINLCWMPLTATGVVARILTRPQALAEAAGEQLTAQEQQALLRPADSPWTLGDVPLLDEAADLIGPEPSRMAADARRNAERAQTLEHARAVLDNSGDAAAMLTAEMLADRFEAADPVLTLAERAGQDRSWAYGHVVVDEAQELSPMQWRLVGRRVPSRSMTVVGDVAQTGSAAGTSSWEQALAEVSRGRWQVRELTVNYRTPARVMTVATAVLHAAGIEVAAPNAAREGDADPRGVRLEPGRWTDPQVLAGVVAAELAEEDAALGGGQLAVVLPRSGAAERAQAISAALPPGLAGRVQVLTCDEVKGLEFDVVLVLDPQQIVQESARGVNDLYVALTRPTQRLVLLHPGLLPPGLQQLTGDC